MNGSYVFLLHLIGFGIVCTLQIVSWTLSIKAQREKDWNTKLNLLTTMNIFTFLSPIATAILFLTGVGNIYNRYYSSPELWTAETWLVAKIILVVVLVLLGNLVGPRLGKKKVMTIRKIIEQKQFENGEKQLKSHNAKILVFLSIQSLLLLAILYLSVFGAGKHPGVF
jgi:hypothetical protein